MLEKSEDQNYHDILFKSHIEENGFLNQQIESFNFFVDHGIQSIINTFGNLHFPDNSNISFEFKEVFIDTVKINENMKEYILDPQECRLRDLTYESNIYCNIEFGIDGEIKKYKKVFLCTIPIMVRSNRCSLYKKNEDEIFAKKECLYDTGGYFIINGTEKSILISEQRPVNQFLKMKDSKGNNYIEITAVGRRTKTKISVIDKKGLLYLYHRTLEEDIPIVIILKCLGAENDNQIFKELCLSPENFENQVKNAYNYLEKSKNFKQNQTKNGIAKNFYFEVLGSKVKGFIQDKLVCKKERAFFFLDEVLFPQIYPDKEYIINKDSRNYRMKKRYTLNYLINQLCPNDKLGENFVVDDLDHVALKRFSLSGELLSYLFEDSFQKLCGLIVQSMKQKNFKSKNSKYMNFDPRHFIKTNIIGDNMKRAISTGKWILSRFNMKLSSVTSTLPRVSFLAALEMLCRINSSLSRNTVQTEPRNLKSSQWGMICPVDTPEGDAIGLVKHLAILSLITTSSNKDQVIEFLNGISNDKSNELIRLENIYDSNNISFNNFYSIFVDGEIFGFVQNASLLKKKLIEARRNNIIEKFVGIDFSEKKKSLFINLSAGRICRALIIVENGVPLVTKQHIKDLIDKKIQLEDLRKKGFIEYLDSHESKHAYIALSLSSINEENTHLEINKIAILGILACLIPLSNHNQSPRNTYQCSMGKQSVSFPAFNHQYRIDKTSFCLPYVQKPLVGTKMNDFLDLPTGCNAIIAVMSFSGHDIEDAVILNKSSLERGFGRTIVYKKECFSLESNSKGQNEILNKNAERVGKRACLDADGLPSVSCKITQGDIIFDMMVPDNENNKENNIRNNFFGECSKYKESPKFYGKRLESRIDSVCLTANKLEKLLYKIKLREVRIPELGDKFSSRHGQKGVCGLICPEENMPFTEDGIIPDLIMNPHGFPSRMTMGKIIELITGKAMSLKGETVKMDSFSNPNLKEIEEYLEKCGYCQSGKEFMYSGISGEKIKSKIFVGPMYYQKLKHMVSDKFHSRTIGKNNALTKQPTEGKQKEGGLRLGEMEKDVIISSGASFLLNERMLKGSDEYRVKICKNCGIIVGTDTCNFCSANNQNFTEISIPYASKLMIQELLAIGIILRFNFK